MNELVHIFIHTEDLQDVVRIMVPPTGNKSILLNYLFIRSVIYLSLIKHPFFGSSKWPHQHGGAKVKLLGHLGDVGVDWDQLLRVHLLHLSDDVRHPLKLPLRPCHPDEVDLRITNDTDEIDR